MKNYLFLKRKRNSTGTGKMIIGTVAGIAAGFTTGLLMAPCPGKEMRSRISSRTNETLEKLKKGYLEGVTGEKPDER